MSNYFKLRKGLNIPLNGDAEPKLTKELTPRIVAVKPTDFKSFVPKMMVREGDKVLAGTPLFSDKKRPEILVCSPVSGTVKEVSRGAKRKIMAVVVEASQEQEYLPREPIAVDNLSREEIVELLLESGLWALIQQRPYGTIPSPEHEPKAIFISGFDSSPLAPDYDFIFKEEIESIQFAIKLMSKLTKGGIHLSLHASNHAGTSLHRLENAMTHIFEGPHPAGNVGVQIHHISPMGKGEIAWTIDLYALVAIARFFTKGQFDLTRTVAITGPRAKNPSYIKTLPGFQMSEIAEYVEKEHKDELAVRYISGSVLSGHGSNEEGYFGLFDNRVTLISEGNYYEMLGWIKPFRLKKFSTSRTYFSWLFPKKKYSLDTNLNGGERAFVMTGVYEKVLPMDIYPLYLIKAILAEDIDKMEQYGIYEVVEEDFALCEYVCPSKAELQKIISQGIELMIKEMS